MVTGEANFRVREDVRITNIKVLSQTGDGYETNSAEYYKDGTKVMATLPKLESTVTYQVEITNNTSLDYYLKSKSDVITSNPSMKYTIVGLDVDSTVITKNSKTTFTIVVGYQQGVSLPSDNTVTFEIRYVFDILDITPPIVVFEPEGGEYKEFQTVTVSAYDDHYDHMDIEVHNSKGKIEGKSQTNIVSPTYQVSLDSYDTYTIYVKAYDQRGNVQTTEPRDGRGYTYQRYEIKKPAPVNLVKHLKSLANPESIATYAEGTTTEMYTFSHDETEQTGALTDYRYIGKTPNNFVYFNCTDDSDVQTCEIWRIIGVFSVDDGTGKIEERVKIIKDTSLGDMEWSSSINDWTTATLKTYLNEVYYGSLSKTAQDMIGDTKYYLGGSTDRSSGSEHYNSERGTATYQNSRTTNWTGKIGLMYASDHLYTFALGVYDSGYNGSYVSGENTWIVSSTQQWTMTTHRGSSALSARYVFYVYADNGGATASLPSNAIGVRPVLYLKTDVMKVDGNGSATNPYIIKQEVPSINFSILGGTYYRYQTFTIYADSIKYSHMEVEVRNQNGIIASKSNNNIIQNHYTITLDSYDTYTVYVTAYDENGKSTSITETFIIRPPEKFVQYLKSTINSADFTYTNSTDEQKKQMYTFHHIATEQTGELTDYRYIGNTPNNYVYFNCTDDSDVSTCEIWRIIGIFSVENEKGNMEERVKMIRENTAMKWIAWDENRSTNWPTASLNTYLNGTYLTGLSGTAQKMIGDAKYYLGSKTTSGKPQGPEYYGIERSTVVFKDNETHWLGKVGLMYPSDYAYTYALGVNDACYEKSSSCTDKERDVSWLQKSADWTITPCYSYGAAIFAVRGIYGLEGSDSDDTAYNARPVLYLVSDVFIVGGDGSGRNPYQLAIN